MTAHWSADTIRSELDAVSQRLDGPATAYLSGGSAMVVRGFKQTTGDIDLLVPTGQDLRRFETAAVAGEYTRPLLQKDPDGTASMCRLQDDSGREIDVFNTQIGDGLVLSDGLRGRSEPYVETERATIRVISPEDIYLSKLVHSGRLKDSSDTTALADDDLDFGVIRTELAAQNELVERDLSSLLVFGDPDEG